MLGHCCILRIDGCYVLVADDVCLVLLWFLRCRMSREFFPYCCRAVALFACVAFMGCSGDEAAVPGTPVEKEVVAPPSIKLLDAAWVGDVDSVRQHIAAGTDLDSRGEDGGTSLHAVAARGNTEVAMLLIDAGADVNAKKADGGTPLHSAAFFCHEKIVRALLANGADKTIPNGVGATAYDSVAGSFEDVKPIYDLVMQVMGPLGLQLDYERIQDERPNMAELLSAQ